MLRKKRIKKNLKKFNYIKPLDITKYVRWIETNCHLANRYYRVNKNSSFIDILRPLQLEYDFQEFKRLTNE